MMSNIAMMSSIICVAKTENYERGFPPDIIDYANKNKDEGFFNDVVIETNDGEIPANRMILSSCSLFF